LDFSYHDSQVNDLLDGEMGMRTLIAGLQKIKNPGLARVYAMTLDILRGIKDCRNNAIKTCL
jgi:hypothetical protein